MKKINKAKGLLLLCMSLVIFAVPLRSAPKRLTLEKAIEMAVQTNFDAKKSRLGVQKAEARKDEALGNSFPTITFNAGYTNNVLKPKFFLPDFSNPSSGELVPVEIGATNSFMAGVKLTQILFNAAVFTGISTANMYYDASKEQYKSSITKTISSVKQSFYGVLLAKELVNVYDTVLTNAKRNLDVTQKMYNEGFIPEFDLIQAKTSVKNLEPQLLNAELNYHKLMNIFKYNLGIDVSDSVELDGNISAEKFDLPSLDSLLSMLDNVNYDLRALKLAKTVQERKIDVYKADYYPALYLLGDYNYEGQSNTWDYTTFQSASIGVNLQFTIFQGLQRSNRVQQARVDYLTAVEQYNQTDEALKMQLKNSMDKLNTAKKKFAINKGNVERARRGYQIAEIRYKEGVGSQIEINNSNTALANANLNYLQAVYEYLEAKINLQELLGMVPEKYIDYFDK